MYEELVKQLREEGNWLGFTERLRNLFNNAADAIEELSREVDIDNAAMTAMDAAMPRWISVTERLPDCFDGEEIGNVEWISHGTVYAGCFGRGGKWRDAYFRTWNDDTEGIDAYDAECWRIVTLPEPPKEET